MFDKLIATLIEKLVAALTPIIAAQAEKLGKQLMDKLSQLLPVIVGAIVKALGDELAKHIPDLKIPDVAQIPEVAKNALDKVIEADPDLPGISNVFDLSEWLKGLKL